MKPGNVPTARVAPLLARMIVERWPDGEGCEVLGDKIGCHPDTIRGVLNQKNEGVEFDLVDKMFCALVEVSVWQNELKDVYDSVRFVETCALHSCSRTFPESTRSGKRKRFCSDNCRSLHHKTAAGLATGDRHVQRGRCFKGHKMTPENTMILVFRDGATRRQCRKCKLASMAAYKRRKRREDPQWRIAQNAKQRAYRARRRQAVAA